MAQSTEQRIASIPAERQSAGAFRAAVVTAKPRGNGAARSSNGEAQRLHDGAPGLGHPIFDELIAELGDPRRPA